MWCGGLGLPLLPLSHPLCFLAAVSSICVCAGCVCRYLLCGAASGAAAAAFTNPLDVVKTRLQTQNCVLTANGVPACTTTRTCATSMVCSVRTSPRSHHPPTHHHHPGDPTQPTSTAYRPSCIHPAPHRPAVPTAQCVTPAPDCRPLCQVPANGRAGAAAGSGAGCAGASAGSAKPGVPSTTVPGGVFCFLLSVCGTGQAVRGEGGAGWSGACELCIPCTCQLRPHHPNPSLTCQAFWARPPARPPRCPCSQGAPQGRWPP